MATEQPTDAEVFQLFLAEQVAIGGCSKSPEELVRLWRERETEKAESLKAVREGIDDMNAGRVHPFAAVNDEIRRRHGWAANE